jgi:hypothetical protein
MSKRLVTGMVLALALTSTAAPAALANDQVTSVLTPADIAGPDTWAANQEAIQEAVDAAKAAIEAANTAKETASAASKVALQSVAEVEKLSQAVTSTINGLKAQLTSLSSLMTRIAKKLGA